MVVEVKNGNEDGGVAPIYSNAFFRYSAVMLSEIDSLTYVEFVTKLGRKKMGVGGKIGVQGPQVRGAE